MPQADLLTYLETLKPSTSPSSDHSSIGIGLDSCVLPTRHPGLFLIETTDFFYPLIDDPYNMGKIACANVLSDLYAMGVSDVDNMLLLLGVAKELTAAQRKVVIPMMMSGFRDLAGEAGVTINGGQTVVNPWMTVGGVATSICKEGEFIIPDKAAPGDVIVLTKPLGIQAAVNLNQWMQLDNANWQLAKSLTTPEFVAKGYQDATTSMITLNLTAARLMKKHNGHAATDVTGFGILGHARNLAEFQNEDVEFVIHTLPVLAGFAEFTKKLADAGGRNFRITSGTAAETSGGLLIAMAAEDAARFVEEMRGEGGLAWIIGDIVEGKKTARIVEDPKIIDVSY